MSISRPQGLWLISLAAFSSMASMRVCDPMLVALSTEFQVSVGDASRVVSAFAVAYGCMQLFYGPLGDRIGKLRVINAAVLACAVLACMFVTACVLLFVRMGSVRRVTPIQTEGSYWRQALSGQGLLRVPRVRWVLTVTVIEGALAYSQMARRWLGWFGERGLARLGSALVAAGLLLAWTAHVAFAALGCLSAGLGFYMLHNTLQTQATQMAPEARGSAVTLFACMLFFGQSAGVLVAAQTVDHGGLNWAYTVSALGMLLLGAVVARWVRAKA